MSVTLNFEERFPRSTEDIERMNFMDTNPINVFFLSSEKDLKKMKSLTKSCLSKLVNVILLIETEEERPLFEFCMQPVGNPFFLQGDMFFLVKCYDDNTIREWHPASTNQMRITEWATWKTKTGLLLKTEKLTTKERNNMAGQLLITTSEKVTGTLGP